MSHQRGIGALGILIGTAIVFAVAAFAILVMALSAAQQSKEVHEDRLRALYAAEGGLVWAMQQLWANPGWSGGSTTVNGVGVTVTIPRCSASPCEPRTLQARASY
jgi:hypothetical protein